MVVEILVGGAVCSVCVNCKNFILIFEVAQELSSLVFIETVNVHIKPERFVSNGGTSFALESYTADRILGEEVSSGGASLNCKGCKVVIKEEFLEFRTWAKSHSYALRLSVRVGGEPENFGVRSTHCDVILLVSCNCGNCKPLNVAEAVLSVSVYGVVNRSEIVLYKDSNVDDVLAYKGLVCNLCNQIFAVLEEDNYIINI